MTATEIRDGKSASIATEGTCSLTSSPPRSRCSDLETHGLSPGTVLLQSPIAPDPFLQSPTAADCGFYTFSPIFQNNIFSVRSAYHAEWNHQFGRRCYDCGGQGSMAEHPIWKKIWEINVPAKVKIFTWKTLHGAMPCYAVLADRHIKVKPQCPQCKLGPEDIAHVLFQCGRAKQVWEQLGLTDSIDEASLQDRSGPAVLEYLICNPLVSKGRKDHFAETVMIAAWHLWWQRRRFVHNEPTISSTSLGFAISSMVHNYGVASLPKAGRKEEMWLKPPSDYVKINVDASFSADELSGTIGAVIRNSHGEFIVAANDRLPLVADVVTAEVAAVQLGLELAISQGCRRIIINCDNSEVVDTLNKGERAYGPATAIFEKCFALFKEFGNMQITHCSRNTNSVAHELARQAKFSPVGSWASSPPSCLIPLLLNDVTLVAIIK